MTRTFWKKQTRAQDMPAAWQLLPGGTRAFFDLVVRYTTDEHSITLGPVGPDWIQALCKIIGIHKRERQFFRAAMLDCVDAKLVLVQYSENGVCTVFASDVVQYGVQSELGRSWVGVRSELGTPNSRNSMKSFNTTSLDIDRDIDRDTDDLKKRRSKHARNAPAGRSPSDSRAALVQVVKEKKKPKPKAERPEARHVPDAYEGYWYFSSLWRLKPYRATTAQAWGIARTLQRGITLRQFKLAAFAQRHDDWCANNRGEDFGYLTANLEKLIRLGEDLEPIKRSELAEMGNRLEQMLTSGMSEQEIEAKEPGLLATHRKLKGEIDALDTKPRSDRETDTKQPELLFGRSAISNDC